MAGLHERRREFHDKAQPFSDHAADHRCGLCHADPVAYIAQESHHDCVGDNCAICHQLQVCENLLKSIGLAGAAAVFAAAVGYAPCSVIPSCAEVVRTFTLVSLKVKLSD